MKILAIESSCDETAAAVLSDKNGKPRVLSNIISSQIDIHKEFGGVVPEVAARAHIENIIPVIQKALAEAKITPRDLDKIAVTYGPGLIGSLIVGVETSKALSIAWKKPLIPINHLEGHIYASFLGDKEPTFPVLTLLVSGGNTLLILMKSHHEYKVIGATRDDAAGEAFDKVAKLLGLPYPGGPSISKAAKNGNPARYALPIVDLTPAPQKDADGFLVTPEPSCDFSFSGLKTAVLNITKSSRLSEGDIHDLAASFENTVAKTLAQNSLRAIEKFKPKSFVISGGVAANTTIRNLLKQKIESLSPKIDYHVPAIECCTDNAAMIGAAAFYKQNSSRTESFKAEPNLTL